MLLFLLHDNSILSRAFIQHPVITFCMFCSVQYRLFWNPGFSFYILYFYILWRSIVLLWAQISVRCLEYPICRTEDCWSSVDDPFHDWVMKISCTVLPEMVAITSYMNYCHKATLRLPKMQDQKIVNTPLTLIFRMGQGACRCCFSS